MSLSRNGSLESADAAAAEDIPTYETNAMSLFFAHATPMLNALSLVVTKHVKVKDVSVDRVRPG